MSYTFKVADNNEEFKTYITENDTRRNSFVNAISYWVLRSLENITSNPRFNRFSIILDGDTVIAVCIGEHHFFTYIYLSHVYVLDDARYRGKGLCEKVVNNLVLSYFTNNNFFSYDQVNHNYTIKLEVLNINVPAIRCYQKIGFERIGEVPGEEEYDIMELTVNRYINYLFKNYLIELSKETNKQNNSLPYDQTTITNLIQKIKDLF